MTTERVHFRLIQCPGKCKTLLCCVNPRFYNYCPECGSFIAKDVRGAVLISDDQATLRYDHNKLT